MDWIILISITVLSAVAGYRKGALTMTWRLLSFVAGYVVAWKLTPSFAQWLLDTHKLQGVIVYPIAGLSLFLGIGIVLNIVSSILFLFIPAHIKEGGKWAGILLGGFFGAVFALLCVWTISIVQHAISQHQQPAAPTTTAPHPSALRQLAGKIISTTAQTVIGDKNSSAVITGQLLSDPVSVSQELNYLAKQPDARELFSNPDNYHTLVNGTAEDIMKLPQFQKLLNDDNAMDTLSKTGLTGNTPQNEKITLANNLSTYAKNIDKVKNTPEYDDVMNDPDIIAAMQAGDYAKLLTNEKVRLLTEKITRGSSTPLKTTADTLNNNTKNNYFNDIGLPQKVYRWQDKKGKTHFSDTVPPLSEVNGEVTEIIH